MQNVSRIALAVAFSLSLSSTAVFAEQPKIDVNDLPQLSQEMQHKTASKRITATYSRSHYKQFELDDQLSSQIFDLYLKQLDYNRSVFLQSDIDELEKYRNQFDDMIVSGKLADAYDIYNLNVKRRYERYQHALTLLENEFDFKIDESYEFDREEAEYAKSKAELDEIWRKRVKYDALNLKLAGKEWPKIKEILSKRYNYAIKRLSQGESEDVFQVVMNSFSRTVEPHTSYLSPRNAERFQMEMNLSLEGIGAVLRAEDDFTVIQSVVTGGPADKSKKIKPKDKVIAVAQGDEEFVDVVGWRLDDVVDLIKGPKGTTVRLQVQKGEDDPRIVVVSIVRDKIKLEDRAAKSEVYIEKNADGEAIANGKKLGVITIPSFYNKLSRDVAKEIAKLKEENVQGIVVDLRGNGGGSLTEATLLTGLFIDKGPVVQVRGIDDRIEINKDTDGLSYYDGPLTVIVDRYSASASEIFAAALQDYGRAVIIGENTFGKGTVQQHRGLGRVYDLYENPLGSIQFTIAKFYRIDGGSTQHKGVQPDIEFPSAIDPAEWGESQEEHALVWDKIKKAPYRRLHDFSQDISYLQSLHDQRIKKNEEFKYLAEDIAEYQAKKDDKSISLNYEERKAEREENKAKRLARANLRLQAMNKEPVSSIDDIPEDLSELDPFLDESANITFDLVEIGKLAKK
ncbi:carboxy terminal-processing peptidase [Thalassotalea mangrovi]|uniref:Carboxy terminal-processing peptidase n=1 Tax=Thalassotalea mangrovi TaxID=2572245 RepID=A0A4U1B5V1_9GAMM|nr:carboxy terminal-processing peptidase [Thalassotalea mangrovi]TKB45872.1 carboxy terminal-processing peptidase [Thalassotalea mangrovi]